MLDFGKVINWWYIGNVSWKYHLDHFNVLVFAGNGCSMNKTAITLNLVFAIIISGMSIHNTVQEYNPQAGLAQSSMVVFYCTYLIMSAVASEPDDKYCNPLIRSSGTRTASVILGAFFTFIAVAYTTTRAAANSAFSSESNHDFGGVNNGITTQQPSARNEMRYQAIKQAVDEGLLPESALNQLIYMMMKMLTTKKDSQCNTTTHCFILFSF